MGRVLSVATANLLNLALPERVYYENREPYSQRDYDKKIAWLADFIGTLDADVVATQEVWDEQALKDLAERIGQETGRPYRFVSTLGAENTPDPHATNGFSGGAQGTPGMGFMMRLEVLAQKRFVDIPQHCQLELPELGLYDRFARPPVQATMLTPDGRRINVINVHLKSKRPKFLRDDKGNPLEDIDDPRVRVRAKMRSLCMRGAEAAAIRHLIIELLEGTREPLILMGDVNDSSRSVTTQLMAETSEVVYDRSSRDIALFNAYEYQTKQALGRDVAYSHIFQGYPEVLDQIFVSEEFLPQSKYSIGEVLRVDYFNDHLKLRRNQRFTDHGFVRGVIKLYDK